MDQDETLAKPITNITEQSHTMCPNKSKQEFDSEKVNEESDDLNKSGVGDGFESDKHITNRTQNEIREQLGFNSEDVHDGFLNWITGCVGSRSKRIDKEALNKKNQMTPLNNTVNIRNQPSIDPDVYSFTNSKRGYLVNIVNDRFAKQSTRKGAHLDLLKMIEIGRKFGFRLFNYNNDKNLTRHQTMSLLTEIQHADHSQCDCFMFMISTHGMEEPNLTLRGKMDQALMCADDGLIFTSTILNMFNDSNCPTLKGKPKIFFIQACRGEAFDCGSDVFVVSPKGVDRTYVTIDTDKQSRRPNKKKSVDESDTKPFQDSWAQHGMKQVQYPPSDTSNTTCTFNQHVQFQCESHPSHSGSQPRFVVPKCAPFPAAAPIRNNYTAKNVPFFPAGGAHIPRPFPLVDTPSLRCNNDMLVMYAIPQGLYAWRSKSYGSWMIYYLHQILMSYNMNTPTNFLSLLTKVSAVMSRRETNAPFRLELHKRKAIPVIEHKLDKDIIFRSKVPGAVWIKKVKQMSL